MNTNRVAVRYQVTCDGKRYRKQLGIDEYPERRETGIVMQTLTVVDGP